MALLSMHEATTETVRWAAGLLGALMLGWATSRFQQGGKRRRERSEIQAELELLKALDNDADETLTSARQQLRDRLRGRVQEYATPPTQAVETSDWEPLNPVEWAFLWLGVGAMVSVITALIGELFGAQSLTPWYLLGITLWVGFSLGFSAVRSLWPSSRPRGWRRAGLVAERDVVGQAAHLEPGRRRIERVVVGGPEPPAGSARERPTVDFCYSAPNGHPLDIWLSASTPRTRPAVPPIGRADG